ncbi:MAG TPA: hypothetical protein VLR26_08050 [Frankiaceae bacterium]|nr:hypothetical protein [Frankiaceae bacterium]
MVLIVELLLAAGILGGVYRWATRPGDRMSVVEPDRRPAERQDGPLTADDLVAMHIPAGLGYRKVDVDRLLDRLARQLPRAVYESTGPGEQLHDGSDGEPAGRQTATSIVDGRPPSVSLDKEADHG